MTALFLLFYRFFAKNKVVFIISMIGIFAVCIFFSARNQFEEDITKILPKDKNSENLSFIFNNSRFSDKIIFSVHSESATPEKLIEFADSLTEIFKQVLLPAHIKELDYRFSQDAFIELNNYIFNNLPVFLEDEDYNYLQKAIQKNEIDKKIEANFNILMSPAGFAMKKFILNDPLSLTSVVMKKLQFLNLNENYIIENDRIFTKDRKSLVFFVRSAHPAAETSQNSILLDKIAHILSDYGKNYNNIEVDYFGVTPVAVGNAKQLKQDIWLTVGIAVLGIFGFVIWFYKSWRIALISFLPAIFGGSIALASIYFIQGKISAISIGAGSVILGIIVDYAFYIYNSFHAKRTSEKVIEDMTFTLLICSLTTATAFFSLLFVKSQVLHDLGIFAGISIIGAAIFSLIFLPHLINHRLVSVSSRNQIPALFSKLLEVTFEKKLSWTLGIIVVSVISLFFSGKVQFETDMNKMNFLSEKLKSTQDKMSKDNDVALKSIYLISKGKSHNEALRKFDNIANIIKGLIDEKLVKQCSSPNNIIVSDSLQKLRLEKWSTFWTEDKKNELKKDLNAAGEKYKFKPNAFVPFEQMLNAAHSMISINESSELKNSFLKEFISESAGMVYLTSVLKVDDVHKPIVLERLKGLKSVTVFDRQSYTNMFVENIKLDFDLLVKLSLLLVSIVLILSFGRIELGLIVSVPMFFSWLITLGFMGLFGIKFNIFNIIISTFIFGLGTDYSILMMRGLQQKFKYGTDEMFSYKSSVFVSATTTLIGVGVLLFAKHPALNSIAVISIIGMLTVVLVSWTIQPILFKWLLMSRKGKRSYPITVINLIATGWTQFLFFIGCVIGFITGHLIFTLIPANRKSKSLKYFYHLMMKILCGTVIVANFHITKRIRKSKDEDFSKPAVIICNHQSHVDIPLMIMKYSKLILLTNDWVWNSPFFGSVVKFADYYPVSLGYENSIERLQDRVDEGYSIVVFPEGTRTKTGEIQRFHKGAFFLAEQLNIDILPVLIHGSGMGITKGEVLVKKTEVSIKFLDRISPSAKIYGNTFQEKTKQIASYFKNEYGEFSAECETPKYFRDKVVKNYIYKGPILEWYVRSKLTINDNYTELNDIVPKAGLIVDLGCGYGYTDYMLAHLSKERKIIAVDFDAKKIQLASNCHIQPDNLQFTESEIITYKAPVADCFILGDVLHYFRKEEQYEILEHCLAKLNSNGLIIVRDANKDFKFRSYGTKFTEIISTSFGFNKAKYSDMQFETKNVIDELVKNYNLNLLIKDNSKFTSNMTYVIRKKPLENIDDKM